MCTIEYTKLSDVILEITVAELLGSQEHVVYHGGW